MKTLSFTFIFPLTLIFLLTSCSSDDIIQENDFCSHITINIKNETGTDIQDFGLGEKIWDNLKDGTTIQNICLDDLILDGEFPMIYFNGIMDGEDVKSMAFLYWCGTGMYSVNEGVYTIQIKDRSEFNTEYVNYEFSTN